MTGDAGTCLTCGDSISMIRTRVEPACNEPCSEFGGSEDRCGSMHEFAGDCGSCGGVHAFRSEGGKVEIIDHPVTVIEAMMRRTHARDPLAISRSSMARDFNLWNVGVDSVMPALLAHLQEEELYFEKWHVRDGDPGLDRWLDRGAADWQSYKCWVLYSIPRDEFMRIADEFRSRFSSMYELSLDWMIDDRDRRIEWEDRYLGAELEWAQVERGWNRQDEIVARDHAITIDKDREQLPGRRFSVVGSK